MVHESKNRSRDSHKLYGVDPTPINEIAKKLPLSHERRPDWDVHTLLKLGAEKVSAKVSRVPYQIPETEKEGSLITDFIVNAVKTGDGEPLSDYESQRQINERWSQGSDNYSSIIDDELASFRVEKWQTQILKNAPDKPVLDILDAGCGPGFFSIILSKMGHRVTGLDGADGMLQHAAEKASEHRVFPLFMKGDCHNLPFADQSFDLVVSRNVTHALRNNEQVYAEWKRVLRPGGVLLIFDANWHLQITDPKCLEDFQKREEECFAQFGTNFSGGVREARKECGVHRLGTVLRPGWDLEILKKLGYSQIDTEEDLIEELWDEKEKLLYGGTPLFMIRAVKN